MIDDHDRCEWVNVFFLVLVHVGRSRQRDVKRLLLLLLLFYLWLSIPSVVELWYMWLTFMGLCLYLVQLEQVPMQLQSVVPVSSRLIDDYPPTRDVFWPATVSDNLYRSFSGHDHTAATRYRSVFLCVGGLKPHVPVLDRWLHRI